MRSRSPRHPAAIWFRNVNFAIRGSLAQSFLDTKNVDYDIGDSSESLAVADTGDRAQDFTVLILCFE